MNRYGLRMSGAPFGGQVIKKWTYYRFESGTIALWQVTTKGEPIGPELRMDAPAARELREILCRMDLSGDSNTDG